MKNWLIEFSRKPRKDGCIEELKAEGPLIREFQQFLGVNEVKTQILALVCFLKTRKGTSIAEVLGILSEYIDSRLLEFYLEELIADGWLIAQNYRDEETLNLSRHVEVALKKSNPELLPDPSRLQKNRVLRRLCVAANSLSRRSKSMYDWDQFVKNLMQDGRIKLVRYLKSYKLNLEQLSLVLFITAQYINEQEEIDTNKLASIFTTDAISLFYFKNRILHPQNPMVQDGLLQTDQNFRSDLAFYPSPGLLQVCLPGLLQHDTSPQMHESLQKMATQQFRSKKLYYNANDQKQIELIRQILDPSRQKEYQQLISEQEQFKGLTFLVSGGPGVGKTELVKQIAIASGRDLFLFQPSKQRNKWYGDSEKAIQAVFDDYKKAAAQAKLTPILFFNEADSIIHKRSEMEHSATNTENVVQTILLQELEQFDGILICTTNRPDSFDEAFYRRFLFQLQISAPNQATRLELLQHYFPELNAQDAEINSHFEFTAAELDNFKKQRLIEKLASATPTAIEFALKQFLVELKNIQPTNKIGYQ